MPSPVSAARRLLVMLALLVPALLVGAPVWAHATLQGSTPGSGAVVGRAPHAVTLRFDEAVGTLPGSVRVYGPHGERVDAGEATHPRGDPARVSVPVDARHRGTYVVSWRVVSADSHPVSGAFRFSVGARSTAPAVATDHSDRLVGVLLGVTRWLGYLGAALLVGGVAFLRLCWPEGWPGGWRSDRARRIVRGGLLATAAGAVLGVLLKAPYDAGFGLGHLGAPAPLREVVGSTYGQALLVRLGLLVLAAVLLAVLGRRRWQRAPRGWDAAALVVGAAVCTSFGFAGHPVTEPLPALGVAVDAVHVAAMTLWIGGLVLLYAVVLRRPTVAASPASSTGGGAQPGAAGPEVDPAVRAAAARFSTIATICVLVLIASGSYQAWREVGAWGALPSTRYGQELLVKIGLFALVLLGGLASRTWVRRAAGTLRTLRASLAWESVGLLVVLGLTAALVATPPAGTAYHPITSTTLRVGPETVYLHAEPDGERTMLFHILLRDSGGRAVEPPGVSVTATLPDQDLGPLPLQLGRPAPGQRIGTLTVPVTGTWLVTVRVRTTAIDEYAGTVDVPIH